MIIFDEKKYAEKMISSGFLTKHKNIYELHILSKYYFHIGLLEQEVKKEILGYCEKHIPHFNKDEWYTLINKTVKSALKNKIITDKSVHITKPELEYIQQLPKLNEQKVAFVLLVLYKFYGFKKFEVSIEDLYKLCKLNLNSKAKLEILQSLTSREYIDITMGGKRWVKFVDKKGKPELKVSNFDDFIFEYLKFIGEGKYGYCDKCSKIIKINGKHKKYCNECAVETDRLKAKNRMKKVRCSKFE